MAKCLGLYIEENIIKYAKVSKEKDKITVESFGVKFYDQIGKAIKQIVEETYSFKTPINVNLSEEMYNYFEMFALLNKNDLQKAIKTEFDAYCEDKGYNPNVFETRYAITNSEDKKDSLKVIHVSDNKIELNKRLQQLEEYKLTTISPISMSIPNLIEIEPKENILIVNIEDKTTITTVLDEKIFNIDILEQGSSDILSKINLKENSYSKSYEICKNTTIYTSEGKEFQETEATYLEDIMPTLYEIVSAVSKIINQNGVKINKIYITGTGALINNVDLYFQEYFTDSKCEILKPSFVEDVKDINIKDYIEVNTAISLGLMGLNEGIAGMNFKRQSFLDKVPDWLKLEVNPDKTKQEKKFSGGLFTFDLGEKLDKTEISLIRVALSLLILFVVYGTFSVLLEKQMEAKKQEADSSIQNTNSQIALANKDSDKLKAKTNEYTTMIKNLEDINDRISDRNKTRNSIPNLLEQIMQSMPENVQLTSIENTNDRHIQITAQSNQYDQLGYFQAIIKTSGILTNVISTAGEKDNNVISVKIEGDLP